MEARKYRKEADGFIRRAERESDTETKVVLLARARAWLALAEACEAEVASKKRLARRRLTT